MPHHNRLTESKLSEDQACNKTGKDEFVYNMDIFKKKELTIIFLIPSKA